MTVPACLTTRKSVNSLIVDWVAFRENSISRYHLRYLTFDQRQSSFAGLPVLNVVGARVELF